MCGIIGYVGATPAAPLLYTGLSFLQHRGQDSAGIATLSEDNDVFIEKGQGIARHVFNSTKIEALQGFAGIGHVRYSTSGSARTLSEMQPFYVNQPYGITLAHNGNLTNYADLRTFLHKKARRHINSASDSEALLNMLACFIAEQGVKNEDDISPNALFAAIEQLHKHCQGAYAVVALIAGVGLLAFRDPLGIRPLSLSSRNGNEWLVASESAAFRPLGFKDEGDIAPGEAVFIDLQGNMHRCRCAKKSILRPCIFEYIYLARPDSILDGVLVYEARLNMGRRLAEKIRRDHAGLKIDCVVPVPDSGRVAAMELAQELHIPYREALVKNRHSGRSFIVAGDAARRRTVREKLNAIGPEFANKSVLLVDDSIVRGTTGRELVMLARDAGARNVYLASAAPPVRYQNVYGIDLSTRNELLATGRNEKQIAYHLGADLVIYQSLEDIQAAVRDLNSELREFEVSCFNGDYPVGKVDAEYLNVLEKLRSSKRDDDNDDTNQLSLVLQ